jgi:hypothetical protein
MTTDLVLSASVTPGTDAGTLIETAVARPRAAHNCWLTHSLELRQRERTASTPEFVYGIPACSVPRLSPSLLETQEFWVQLCANAPVMGDHCAAGRGFPEFPKAAQRGQQRGNSAVRAGG